jgi:hypothetical protein
MNHKVNYVQILCVNYVEKTISGFSQKTFVFAGPLSALERFCGQKLNEKAVRVRYWECPLYRRIYCEETNGTTPRNQNLSAFRKCLLREV